RFQSYEGPDDYPDKVDWLNCQKPGFIDLARVPKDEILNRDAYTFFAGRQNGKPTWAPDIKARKPVFENPAGVGWCINVSYNAGLQRYILTTDIRKRTEVTSAFLMLQIPGDPGPPYAMKKTGEKGTSPSTPFTGISPTSG